MVLPYPSKLESAVRFRYPAPNTCPGGGIGRHAGLRSQCRKVCEFESRPGHHILLLKLIKDKYLRELNQFLLITKLTLQIALHHTLRGVHKNESRL